ncbi:hypothetical protein O3P69_005462 [Scylla paramamosain]|uniref:Uncharacterized protein n=1 Tax=Scylla paramamosain TaxID=85552 RepID=A0AAW0U9G0_SCYPA
MRQPQTAPHLRAGLMDGGDDGLAPVSQRLHGLHHTLGHEGVQAGGGFVQKHERRVGQQLQGEAEIINNSPSLRTTKTIVRRRWIDVAPRLRRIRKKMEVEPSPEDAYKRLK